MIKPLVLLGHVCKWASEVGWFDLSVLLQEKFVAKRSVFVAEKSVFVAKKYCPRKNSFKTKCRKFQEYIKPLLRFEIFIFGQFVLEVGGWKNLPKL
jgi:hypothetical protein